MPPPSTAPTGSTTTATPTTTERIANLLNLAQNLLCSVREQQQLTQKQIRRRHYRLQATPPYQRPTANANHAPGNGSANRESNMNDSGASASGNDGARGVRVITNCGANTAEALQLDKTAFCSCVECMARKLHTETNGTGAEIQMGTAAINYMQRTQYSGDHYNSSDNKSSSRVYQHNEGRHRHTHRSSRSNAGNDSTNFQCSICLHSYRLRRPTATQCGHIFCRHCIMKCVSCQGKCPLCNCKLKLSNVFRVYF